MQPVQPMTEKPAKKSNGCLIALAILGGLFLLGGVIVGVVLYGVATSEEGQKVMKLMGGGIQMAQKARNAPGAAELRGIGCDEAMVMDLREVKQLADELDARQQGKMPDDDVMVTCALAFGSTKEISCEEVAKVYLEAIAEKPASFLVTVQDQTGRDPKCMARFGGNGEPLPMEQLAEGEEELDD